MIDLKNELSELSIEDQREVSYYLIRYFKGSPHLDEDGKDIFQDVFDEPIAPLIRESTEKIIKLIESEFGSAFKYDEETGGRVLDLITDFEESVTEEPTREQIFEAEDFLAASKDIPF